MPLTYVRCRPFYSGKLLFQSVHDDLFAFAGDPTEVHAVLLVLQLSGP